MEQSNSKHEIAVEYFTTKLNRVRKDSSLLEAKHSRCLSTIVGRVSNNHSMFKIRYIVTQWRKFVRNRKQCFATLDCAIKKSLW